RKGGPQQTTPARLDENVLICVEMTEVLYETPFSRRLVRRAGCRRDAARRASYPACARRGLCAGSGLSRLSHDDSNGTCNGSSAARPAFRLRRAAFLGRAATFVHPAAKSPGSRRRPMKQPLRHGGPDVGDQLADLLARVKNLLADSINGQAWQDMPSNNPEGVERFQQELSA